MRHFYVEHIQVEDIWPERKACVIQGPEARHITKVLRMKPGDRFVLMDAKGLGYISRIESASSREVKVFLEEPFSMPPASPASITLCQAVSKSQAMDYVIQKTSELGVDHIIPLFSERSVIRLEKDRVLNKMRHWNEIAKNSAKQCGRAIPAKIREPLSFSGLMEECDQKDAVKVILWEEEESIDLRHVIKAVPSATDFVGIIGPEGGFTHKEIETARQAGFVSVSLGNRVLRAETAAVVLVAIVQYELGDLNSARLKLTHQR